MTNSFLQCQFKVDLSSPPSLSPTTPLPNLFIGPAALREFGFRKAHPCSLPPPPEPVGLAHLSSWPKFRLLLSWGRNEGALYWHGVVLSPVSNKRAVPLLIYNLGSIIIKLLFKLMVGDWWISSCHCESKLPHNSNCAVRTYCRNWQRRRRFNFLAFIKLSLILPWLISPLK